MPTTFWTDFRTQLYSLAEFHEIGTERPELGEGIRSFPVERYVLYYRPNGEGSIELVRVLRGSRDVTLIF